MSLFGGSHDGTPLPERKDLVNDIEGSDLDQSDATELASVLERSPNSNLDVNDKDDHVTSSKLSRKDYDQFRRWYYHDLNLVNAFESAASGDLAHNLLGLALEKKAALATQSTTQAPAWTSKKRWINETNSVISGTVDSWAAWPIHLERLPLKRDVLPDPRPTKLSEPVNKKRKFLHSSSELEYVLSGLAMEHAREQFLLHKQSITNNPEDITEQKLNKSNTDLEHLTFSMDEENSFTILNPNVKGTMAKVSELFASLKASREGQLPRAHKRSRRKAPRTAEFDETKIQGRFYRSESSSESENIATKHALSSFGMSTMDQPGLRDWSEILSMAANIGWNPEVLSRTVARCSDMFGETMSFNPLQNPEFLRAETEPNATETPPPPISVEGWFIDSLKCPHFDCEWHWRKLRDAVQLITHIKSIHHWDPRLQTANAFASPPNLQNWSVSDLRCPHTDCAQREHKFAREDALVVHILREHKWDPRSQPRRRDRLIDGVHVDGFLEVIHGRVQSNLSANLIETVD